MCCGEENHMNRFRNRTHGSHHMGMAHGRCGCGCGDRRFLSKKERMDILEEYRESLKKELEGVEEELRKIKEE